MTNVLQFFDAMSSDMHLGYSSNGFSAPGKKPSTVTKMTILFKDSAQCLNLNIGDNGPVMEPSTSHSDFAPDITATVDKTIEEFLSNGLTPDDISLEGLTNRKSTNSKIVNSLDCAYYFLGGAPRTKHGLPVQ